MPPTRGDGAQQLTFWLLGALLVALMAIIGMTHAMVMARLDSIERRLERQEGRPCGGDGLRSAAAGGILDPHQQ